MIKTTVPSNITTRSKKTSSDGSHFQHPSDTSAGKPSATAFVVKNMTEEANKTPEDASKSREAEIQLLYTLDLTTH